MITRLYFGVPKEAPLTGSIQGLEHVLATVTGGFTAYAGTGVWQNPSTLEYVEELSYIYEIVHPDEPITRQSILDFALAMKVLLKQQEVLVVRMRVEKEVL